MTVRIGTSGWVYNHWREVFYPRELRQGDWLSFYAREFDTVEINYSFYWLPSEDAFDRWHEQVPPGFLYAVKASRYLTHLKKLRDLEDPLQVPLRITAPPVYVRFHSDPAHGGKYPRATLETWARRINDWRSQGLDVFAYFNNNVAGYALQNARTLKRLLGEI